MGEFGAFYYISSCKVPWMDDSYLGSLLEKIELSWKSNIYQR